MRIARFIVAAVLCLPGTNGIAALIPDSYNMPNGNTGAFNYWDEIYSGAGCVVCDNAPLAGGKGDLTDGIIATTNWLVAEALPGNGPYVGWTIDPTIIFHWNTTVAINSVTFHLDDSNDTGGASAPSGVLVNGLFFPIPEPPGSDPFSFIASSVGFTGNDLYVSLIRKNAWLYLSEVEFNVTVAAATPEPMTTLLLGVGLAGLGWSRRRK